MNAPTALLFLRVIQLISGYQAQILLVFSGLPPDCPLPSYSRIPLRIRRGRTADRGIVFSGIALQQYGLHEFVFE